VSGARAPAKKSILDSCRIKKIGKSKALLEKSTRSDPRWGGRGRSGGLQGLFSFHQACQSRAAAGDGKKKNDTPPGQQDCEEREGGQ